MSLAPDEGRSCGCGLRLPLKAVLPAFPAALPRIPAKGRRCPSCVPVLLRPGGTSGPSLCAPDSMRLLTQFGQAAPQRNLISLTYVGKITVGACSPGDYPIQDLS